MSENIDQSPKASMPTRIGACVWAIFLLSGCAAPAFVAKLAVPPVAVGVQLVPVSDERAEQQVAILAVGYGGGVVQLDPKPPLAEALQAQLAQKRATISVAKVRVERLDVKAKIGFAKANDLTCEIESWVTFRSDPGEHRVRTVARNTTDFSSLITSMGETIISECLAAHAADIARPR